MARLPLRKTGIFLTEPKPHPSGRQGGALRRRLRSGLVATAGAAAAAAAGRAAAAVSAAGQGNFGFDHEAHVGQRDADGADLFGQLPAGHFHSFTRLLNICSEGFKSRAIFYIRHITSPYYILLFIGCAGNDMICALVSFYNSFAKRNYILEIQVHAE